jgi:integrase
MRIRSEAPAYRRREVRGKLRAYVTLPDAATGRRKDYWLGEFESPASRRKYARLIAAWEATDRSLPDLPDDPADQGDGFTVAELAARYMLASTGNCAAGELWPRRSSLRVLIEVHGDTPAANFGPVALREVREAMIRGRPDGNHPRQPWTRSSCNRQARRVVAMFKWAVSYELIGAPIYQALTTVEPLKPGRCAAVEADPVTPAPMNAIDAVLALANKQIAAMIRVQLATGMRPGEVCAMRLCDLDRSGKVWTYTPATHKTQHRGKRRIVALGPAAQRALREFIPGRQPAAALFSPAEAEAARREALHAERKTPLSCGNRPGTNRVENPRKQAQAQYTSASYGRAVARLCEQAEQLARVKALEAGVSLVDGVRLVARWHPHQLRHNAATEIRRRHGLEAARLMLGHSSALITDAVYADRDEAALFRIAAECG